MQQANGNLISSDAMVAAIFEVVAKFPSKAHEKLRAVSRAGQIAEAYLGANVTDATREIMSKAFLDSSPSEPLTPRP